MWPYIVVSYVHVHVLTKNINWGPIAILDPSISTAGMQGRLLHASLSAWLSGPLELARAGRRGVGYSNADTPWRSARRAQVKE